MPPLASFLAAWLGWILLEEQPEWVAAPRPVLLGLLLALPWALAWRWHRAAARGRVCPEWRGVLFFAAPLLLHLLWLGPCGGLELLGRVDWPAALGSWAGVLPWLWFLPPLRFGEARAAGLAPAAARRLVFRQLRGILFFLLPVAVISQFWEWGSAWLVEPLGEETAERLLGLGSLALVVPLVFPVLPRALGASGRLPAWQEAARELWPGRGRPPRVLYWPTQGLIANAIAVGAGSFGWVLLSDRLLQRLDGPTVRAVLAHELSHLRRGHHLILGAGGLAALFLGEEITLLLGEDAPGSLSIFLGLGLALVPFVPASRCFEMQADLDAMTREPSLGPHLIQALVVLGGPEPRLGFRHLPPARRVEELARCLADPARAEFWHRRARRYRRLYLGAALLALLFQVLHLAGPDRGSL